MSRWVRKPLSLKGSTEACAVVLYRLSVLLPPKGHRLPLQRSLSKLLWESRWLMVHRQVCCQRPCNKGLVIPELEKHCFPKRMVYFGRSLSKDSVRRQKAKDTFPRLKTDPKAEGRRKLESEAPFVCECRTALRDLPRPRKELYRKLLVGFASDNLVDRLVDGGGSLALELGDRFRLLEQLQVLVHSAACTKCVAPSRLELQSGPDWHARLPSLQQWLKRNGWARLQLLRVTSPVLESRRGVDSLHRNQARAAWRCLRHRQCFTFVSRWEACGVSRDASCS